MKTADENLNELFEALQESSMKGLKKCQHCAWCVHTGSVVTDECRHPALRKDSNRLPTCWIERDWGTLCTKYKAQLFEPSLPFADLYTPWWKRIINLFLP